MENRLKKLNELQQQLDESKKEASTLFDEDG